MLRRWHFQAWLAATAGAYLAVFLNRCSSGSLFLSSCPRHVCTYTHAPFTARLTVRWKLHVRSTGRTTIFRHMIVHCPIATCRVCGQAVKGRQVIGLASA
uniref:Putative secreted protein n=1 Tax=Ixodes ricinus TaxID=34613 RepID=A0A6B0U8J1_IXORI